jgi:intracellular multiplication protein IcmL
MKNKILLLCFVGCFVCFAPQVFAAQKFEKDCNCSCKHDVPLNEPNLSHHNFRIWAKEAALASFDYNYRNYKESLRDTSQFYTKKGWRDFSDALSSSGNLQAVINNKLSVSASALQPPTIITEGVVDGVYTWNIEVPLLIEYAGPKKITQQTVNVRMKVIRTDKGVGNQRMGIVQFVAQPADNFSLTGR